MLKLLKGDSKIITWIVVIYLHINKKYFLFGLKAFIYISSRFQYVFCIKFDTKHILKFSCEKKLFGF